MSDLVMKGVYCTLTVDRSNECVDLYIGDTETWKELVTRFGGNKMTVALRGPHDYEADMKMPPDEIVRKLDNWIGHDGELDSIIEIVEEILESAGLL